MASKKQNFIVKEIWADGTETLYISRECENAYLWANTGNPIDAVALTAERWKTMAHVFGQHGTVIDRPVSFELVGLVPKKFDKFYWHPAICFTSLIKEVLLPEELEDIKNLTTNQNGNTIASYSVERDSMYDIDKFVNTNKANIEFDDKFDYDEDLSQAEFEKSVTFDKINTQAFPVLVYELNTKAVAWYDIEMFMGHVQ
jgi:hypothetical protein